MTEQEKGPEKIDMEDVLGEEAAGEPEVEILDPATGKPVHRAADTKRLEEERDKYHDLWVRARADFDNFRKRIERERDEERSQAGAAVVRDILPVIDNLDRALANAPEKDPLREGILLIQRQLKEVLTRAGLTPIEALGETFNPVFHEAVATERTPRFEPNRVLEEIQKGYLFKGRVLRPSLVKVAVRPDDQAGQADGEDGEPRGA